MVSSEKHSHRKTSTKSQGETAKIIFGINGKLRQGKGILAVLLCLVVAEKGGKILSNFRIAHPNASKIDFYQFVELLNKPRRPEPTLLCIDEIYGWLDSYMSQSKANRFASYFVFQSAKLGYEIIYTSQLTMRAMNTLRELCDYRVYAEKDPGAKVFNYYWLDPLNPDEDVPTGDTFQIPYEAAALFWNRYDTFEGVKPYGLKEFLGEIEKTDSGRLDAAINLQVNTLASLIEKGQLPRDTRKIAVESALLSLHESTINASLVGFRLQSALQDIRKSEQQQRNPSTQSPEHQTEIQRLQEKWKKEKGQK